MTAEKTQRKPSSTRKPLLARARAKSKKPKFVRAESWKYDRFSLSWRRPRGLDNKIRRKIKGWPPGPSVGYKGPKIARGLHPSGYREVVVHNVKDLSVVDPSVQAVHIGHTVGKRKRALIIAEAKKLNVKILNVKLSAESEKKEEEEEIEGEEAAGKDTEKEKKLRESKKLTKETAKIDKPKKKEKKPEKQKKETAKKAKAEKGEEE